jgi:SAM-dependent methyltransferase
MGHLPERRYLEREIFPAIRALKPRSILFVGVEHYTRHYRRSFEQSGIEYWTLDIEPAVAAHGAPGKHVIASVMDADRHFPSEKFDSAFLNGVLGWGVNTAEEQNQAIRALYKILRPGGVLVLGWDDRQTPDPLELESVNTSFEHGHPCLPRARTTFQDFNQREFAGSKYIYDYLSKPLRGHLVR